MTKRRASFPSTKPIIGIGNACVDIITRVDDSFLAENSLVKGQCVEITLEQKQLFQSLLPECQYAPGGDAANTLACYSLLGGDAIFLGRWADDMLGNMLMDDWKQRNVQFYNDPVKVDGSAKDTTTCVFCLTTDDKERSFANYPGVCEAFGKADILPSILDKSDFLHISGYLLQARGTLEAYLFAADYIHQRGGIVAFSPSDVSIMNIYADEVAKLVEVTDGIFLNEPDALHLTNTTTLKDACAALKAKFAFGFVTLGKEGVWAFNGDEEVTVEAVKPPGEVVDTNGAGDNFTGGFLYGLRQGWSLHDACILGSTCAAKIVTLYGARLPHDTVLPEMPLKRAS